MWDETISFSSGKFVSWSVELRWLIWTICRNNERKLEKRNIKIGLVQSFQLWLLRQQRRVKLQQSQYWTSGPRSSCLDNLLQLREQKSHQEYRTWKSFVSSPDTSFEVIAQFTSHLQQTNRKENKAWSARRRDCIHSLLDSDPVSN